MKQRSIIHRNFDLFFIGFALTQVKLPLHRNDVKRALHPDAITTGSVRSALFSERNLLAAAPQTPIEHGHDAERVAVALAALFLSGGVDTHRLPAGQITRP
jgi:hypothetical protein